MTDVNAVNGVGDPAGSPTPGALLAENRTRWDGLTFLRAIRDGELPPAPIATTLGFRVEEVELGTVTFALEPDERHYNPIGSVHGGVAATLLDSAMGCAVHSVLPAGVGYTTLELSVNYVRGMTADTGTVLCRGSVIHHGGRVATAEGRLVVAATGKLIAHGTSTLMLLRPGA